MHDTRKRRPAVAIVPASLIEPQPAGPTHYSLLVDVPRTQGRLIGRHLRLLSGKPTLWHLVRRLQRAERVGQVVLALSVAPEDDALAAMGRDAGALVYRGSVHDLVGRLAACAEWLGVPDEMPLARVPADSLLIDPRYVDAGVELLLRTDAAAVEFEEDRAEDLCPGLSAGFLRASLLRLLDRRARSAVQRADVMNYVYEYPDEVGLRRAPLPEELLYLRGTYRLLYQTAEDVALFEALHLRLFDGAPLDTRQALMALAADPVLAALNKGVLRRTTLPLQPTAPAGAAGWRPR